VSNDPRMSPPRIIRNALALRGAQGRRFIMNQRTSALSLFIVLLCYPTEYRRFFSDMVVDI
jgi:hypothetical protein